MSALRNGAVLATLCAALCCAHAQEASDFAADPQELAEVAEVADVAEVAQAQPELERGMASWYGPRFHGRRTASGEVFNMHALTAAHPNLPFGSVVRVTNLDSGRSVDVRINDRGPHVRQRIIDLSRAAAGALGLLDAGAGIKRVALKVLDSAQALRRP